MSTAVKPMLFLLYDSVKAVRRLVDRVNVRMLNEIIESYHDEHVHRTVSVHALATPGAPSLCAIAATNIGYTFSDDGAQARPVQLGVWINGSTRWTLPEDDLDEPEPRLLSSTTVIN